MSSKQQTETQSPQSKLDRFSLSFEYNKTLREIKHEVRARTI